MARGQFLLWRDRQGEEWRTPKTSECLRGDRSLPRGASSTDRELRPERPRLLPRSPQQHVGGSLLT